MAASRSEASPADKFVRSTIATGYGSGAGPICCVPSGRNSTRSIGWRAASAVAALLEPLGIDAVTVELDIEVARDPTELLIAFSAHPHRVLHRGERERRSRIILCDKRFRWLFHDGGRGDQRIPGPDGRIGRQRREVDVDALFAPAAGQRHHPNRVEALADEVGVGIDVVGADTEKFGDFFTDGLRIRSQNTHNSSIG